MPSLSPATAPRPALTPRTPVEAVHEEAAARPRVESWARVLPVWGVWLALVSFVTAHHEYWRDEVRALSIATRLPTYRAVLGELHIEGHPSVWYLMLRALSPLVGREHLLAVTSILVLSAALVLLLRYAPFGWPTKLLIAFGGFAGYEYVVMARNYGISMLAMFAWALAYPSRRRAPWLAGLALLVLANTNAHSALIVGAVLAGWALELVLERKRLTPRERRGTLIGIVLGALGILLCGLTLWPPNEVPMGAAPASAAHRVLVLAYKLAVLPLGLGDMFELKRFLLGAIAHDGADASMTFVSLLLANAATAALIVALAAWLLRARQYPLLVMWAIATFGLKALFTVVYPGSARHQGLLFVFAITLVWIVRAAPAAPVASPGPEGRWRRRTWFVDPVFRATFTFALVACAAAGVRDMWRDVRYARSSMEAMGDWLRAHPAYRDATIISEPAFIVEALPYYASNALYLPRERAYRQWSRFDASASGVLSISRLATVADSVAIATQRPVLLALRADVFAAPQGTLDFGFGEFLQWDQAQIDALRRDAPEVVRFVRADDENVLVFAFPPTRAAVAANGTTAPRAGDVTPR